MKKIITYIEENRNRLKTKLGLISQLKIIDDSDKSVVYEGVLGGVKVAIKFYLCSNKKKYEEFKSEYINFMLLPANQNIVKVIAYDELKIDKIIIPMIIMKKYICSLDEYKIKANWKEFKRLFNFLIDTIEFIHKNNIIHRNIKPENILVSEDGDFVLSDFEIGVENSKMFHYGARLERGEKPPKHDFFAPEQSKDDINPHFNMDIYSLGEICYWYVFNETHREKNGRKITEVFPNKEAVIIESILQKSICNNPAFRYKTILELKKDFVEKLNELQMNNGVHEMHRFHNILVEASPNSRREIIFIKEFDKIEQLILSLNKEILEKKIWFNSGNSNNVIETMELKNNIIMINGSEYSLIGCYIYTANSLRKDMLAIQLATLPPFLVDNEELRHVVLVNDKYILDPKEARNKEVMINKEKVEIIKVKHIKRKMITDQLYFIAPIWNSFILKSNDKLIKQIQDKSINSELLKELISEKQLDLSFEWIDYL